VPAFSDLLPEPYLSPCTFPSLAIVELSLFNSTPTVDILKLSLFSLLEQ
jgi:hypothetical protein